METTALNAYGDFQEVIGRIEGDQLTAYGQAMRQGKTTDAIELRLQRLNLIRKAAAYWSPEGIQKATIYLKLFANV
ncbi:hypothetical protein [Spirosoma fluviale]|uniref:Uncharacterized protein n=1 Tax=Spirosoma fluviale TaxID=1597977 RepID=A0A286FDF8_9BACT|nr:hypothetical protein [Spirosoma fluviale]SOD81019.1 hypothetical protein SAMN06269250_1647 [Spirosoma fluviale]